MTAFKGERDFERWRQAAVERYGLAGRTPGDGADTDLQRLAALAVKLTGAEFAAVNIIDGQRQVTIASTSASTVQALPRDVAFCARVVEVEDGAVVYTPDASRDSRFRQMPTVDGTLASVRFYAGVPLVAEDGEPVGAVCVYSMSPTTDGTAERAALLLDPIRDAAMEILTEKRPTEQEPVDDVSATARLVDRIIDDCLVQTRFQPVVELAGLAVIGFHAVLCGPESSPLADGAALLGAAREAGRLGDLDWLARASALDAALAAGLPAGLTWFVDLEPAGVETPCPQHLLPTIEAARERLDVIVALGDRDMEQHVPRLLSAADTARRSSWGVAMVNVGERPASVGLLPFFEPDVVALDVPALSRLPEPYVADVAAAVRAYAERTGASILATGVDTEPDRRTAVVLGARYARGELFGAAGPLPAALPARVPTGSSSLRRVRPPQPATRDRAPFDVLVEHVIPQRARRADLEHLFRHLLRQCRRGGPSTTTMALVHSEQHFQSRYEYFRSVTAETAYAACLVSGGSTVLATDHVRIHPVHAASLAGQSGVAVLAPHYAGAIFVRPAGPSMDDPDCEVDFVHTQDRALVKTLSRNLASWLPRPGDETGPGADTARQQPMWRLTGIAGAGGARPPAPRTPTDDRFKPVFLAAMQLLLDAHREADVIRAIRRLVAGLGGALTTTPTGAEAWPLDMAFDGATLFVEPSPPGPERDALAVWLPLLLTEASSVVEFLHDSFTRSRPLVAG